MKLLLLLSCLFNLLILPLHASLSAQKEAKQFAKINKISSNATAKRSRKKFHSNNLNSRKSVPNKRKKEKTCAQQRRAKVSWETYNTEEYSFNIPNDWQCIDDKTQLPEKLDSVFIGRGNGGLTPTINIAKEITKKKTREYLEEILNYHRADESTLESDIFTQLHANSVEFTIIKTEKNSSWGKVFCLQAISIINHTAYVFTATTTIEDYSDVSLVFLKTVSSFQLSKNQQPSGDQILEEALQMLEKEKKR
ncbi:hypothetical protein CP10139811_0395 [Chlamydia ibidis]|uniref:Uncharacterized protein n=2 Tax=Chlamydia ibidis TaxID=1405396 RepID=S7J4C6_9CHLA|nr:hypothetical protein [Chlamydia ibidis]EPP34887.1 hypothetical protein CP10139811_0395 [Chlamydia ibidis]EQM62510.1 hypothetical protein H359_0770 [Chlamydia ibidis 10-1398/6]